MKLNKSWLLPATCTIILVVTTYATSTEAAKQKQAEVNLQQVAVAAPSRSLKYGDKTTKKIPNQEALLHPTSASIVSKHNSEINISKQIEKKRNSPSNRTRSRVERIELSTKRPNVQISRRYDSESKQNLLVVQHDVPLVEKSLELFNKPITPEIVGQQQQQRSVNYSRSSNNPIQLQQQQQQQKHHHQPTQQYSNLNYQNEKKFSQIKTTTTAATHNSRQRKPTITSHSTTIASINKNQPPLSSRNANDHIHNPTNNTSIVSHHHVSNQNNEYNNINSKSQHLLASSNAVAVSAGPQTKNSSSKQQRATPRPPAFQLPNNFNIFSPEFWQFLNPTISPTTTTTSTTTTTKRPPKKYKPPTQITTKEEKLSLVKPKQAIPSRTSTTTTNQPELIRHDNVNTTPKRDDGPFRIALPTFNILSSRNEMNEDGEKGKRNVDKENGNLRERFDCPRESEVRFQLFPKICKIDDDCKVWNREEICCEIFGAKSCVSGIPKPLEETSHAPILGVIPRKCPNRPLAELWWEVKECETDMDCWPRVCCPDGRRRYCRTSQPELDTVPVPVQRSFNYLSEYLECTAPPPPIFDLHPKACTSTLDCFPNVCCQEAGLRHCRPPKKSVLTMLANVFNVDFVKRLTQNIVIK
ncbi:uncharacterized protein ACRADG_000607 isoform 2-T6 [Cochliomyia hominivorax]